MESFVTPHDPGTGALPIHSRSVSDSALNPIRSTITVHSHSSSLNRLDIPTTKSLPHSNRINDTHSRHKFHEYLISEMSLIATVIHQHLTATYSHSAGTAASSRYHHNLHAAGSPVPSSGSKRWKITNFFQTLLRHFEVTRNTLPFDDSSVPQNALKSKSNRIQIGFQSMIHILALSLSLSLFRTFYFTQYLML